MKKQMMAALCIVALLCILTGCAKQAEESAPTTEIGNISVVETLSEDGADLSALLEEITADYFADGTEFKTLTDVSQLKSYYMIEPEDVASFAAEIKENSSDSPVEIVLIKAATSDAAERITIALERRYNSIVNLYASYSPEELEIVKACEVIRTDDYVTMVITENYDAIMQTVNSVIG